MSNNPDTLNKMSESVERSTIGNKTTSLAPKVEKEMKNGRINKL
ncbi:unnamed protein product [Tenebrio molitor]|nr:unnamed protein product [Tenebrio molitor]